MLTIAGLELAPFFLWAHPVVTWLYGYSLGRWLIVRCVISIVPKNMWVLMITKCGLCYDVTQLVPRTCCGPVLQPGGLLTLPFLSPPPGTRLQDPEMQCLLLPEAKRPVHQSPVVLPAADGGGMAAISFIGALRIPVSTYAWGRRGAVVSRRAICAYCKKRWPIDNPA